MTKEEFQERINTDYLQTIYSTINGKTPRQVVDCAYPLAHYNEINDIICDSDVLFDTLGEEWLKDYEPPKENLVAMIYDCWLDYHHPER